ncbi:MAG TPA: PfkB family carbohydrate kinase [Candidatus Binataceae bacterium]|nr:PfkB family carbohydrate kinase [Candidatus Binataceae bacterium]
MSIVVVGSIGYDTVETTHGGVTDALGGSASFFALAARFFAPVSIVAAVGTDFRAEDWQLFRERSIDVRGMVQLDGPTFRWHGRYHEDMNIRDTVSLALNVFEGFKPDLLPDQKRADYVFLSNISPELQAHVLAQVASPRVVVADTMNHWIVNDRKELMRLLLKVNILTLNDEEARLLSGESNLVRAGRAILKMGPATVLVKRGEYGVLKFGQDSMFAVPAWPLEEVVDPTGAGDTFAGALMGWIARIGRLNESILRTGIVYGSVLASFAVEQFSVARLAALTWEDVEERYRAFIEMTDSHHSRWMSP